MPRDTLAQNSQGSDSGQAGSVRYVKRQLYWGVWVGTLGRLGNSGHGVRGWDWNQILGVPRQTSFSVRENVYFCFSLGPPYSSESVLLFGGKDEGVWGGLCSSETGRVRLEGLHTTDLRRLPAWWSDPLF